MKERKDKQVMWTKESLHDLVRNKLSEYLFIVVSNREPYIHTHVGSEIRCQVPASGLTVALDPVMRACGGTWVAHGSGDADREVVDEKNKVMVPPDGSGLPRRKRTDSTMAFPTRHYGLYAIYPTPAQSLTKRTGTRIGR